MTRFLIGLGVFLLAIVAMLIAGGTPERRYESAACQYKMIYDYAPDQPMGLVTVGGSRVRVSTNATDFNELLRETRPDAAPMHNLSHSIYSIGKEYVLLRDLARRHDIKSAVVMIEERSRDFGAAHPDFIEIARLKDLPLAVRALWLESRAGAVSAVKGVFLEHFRFFDSVGTPHRETTQYDCDQLDYRLNVEILADADDKFEQQLGQTFDWDLSASQEDGFAVWIDAYKRLADENKFQIMFLLFSATTEPLPSLATEQKFADIFGVPIITLDNEIHASLSKDGKRDASHINAKGREIFLPWLIERIEEKCTRPDGCF